MEGLGRRPRLRRPRHRRSSSHPLAVRSDRGRRRPGPRLLRQRDWRVVILGLAVHPQQLRLRWRRRVRGQLLPAAEHLQRRRALQLVGPAPVRLQRRAHEGLPRQRVGYHRRALRHGPVGEDPDHRRSRQRLDADLLRRRPDHRVHLDRGHPRRRRRGAGHRRG